ncbi:MAG: CsiV family protein [Gammaproteobacteria bacterium]
MLFRLLTIAALSASQLALATDYQIELLIFENLDTSASDEAWESALVEAPVAGTRNVTWVNYSDFQLNKENAYFANSRHYRPLLHTAWQQTVGDKHSAKTIKLPGNAKLSSSGEKLRGTATVSVGRYLHLDLDLFLPGGTQAAFAEPISQPAATLDTGFNPGINQTTSLTMPSQTSGRYHLHESRRMRSNKLHYFDHPHLGVLAIITPLE